VPLIRRQEQLQRKRASEARIGPETIGDAALFDVLAGRVTLKHVGHADPIAHCAHSATHEPTTAAVSDHPPPQQAHWPERVAFTLGHSTLPIDSFLAVLQAYGIERLVDIRTIPRSRHNPQFNDTVLADSLKARHLEYVHLKALGGLRHARKDSPIPAGETKVFGASPITCRPRNFATRSQCSLA